MFIRLSAFEQLREELHKSELKLLDSQSSCDDLSTVNVRLEMRAIVLEEERDRMKAEIVEVETFVKNVKQELQVALGAYFLTCSQVTIVFLL